MLRQIISIASASTIVLSAATALATRPPAIQRFTAHSPQECGIAASKMPSKKLASAVATANGAVCTLMDQPETFDQCIQAAASQRQVDLRGGVDRITADNWFSALARLCGEAHRR